MGDIFQEMESSEIEPVEVQEGKPQLGQMEETLSVPHWKLDRDLLVSAIQPFKEIGGVANNNAVTKSIFLKRNKSNLEIRGNNKDVFLERVVPIENQENILDDPFAVSVQDLDLLVRRSFSKVLLYKPEARFASVRLFKSDFFLDIVNVGEYLFDFVEEPEIREFKSLDVVSFTELITIMFNAMKLSVRPEDKKVILSGKFAYGSFLVSAVRIPFTGFSGIILRSVDLSFLKALIPNQEKILFSEKKDRIFFQGSNFRFSTLKSDIPSVGLQDSLEQSFNKEPVSTATLDLGSLKELVFLVSKLSNTTGMVEFLSQNGEFKVSYMTKSNKKSEFVVGQGTLKEKIALSIEALRKTLGLLNSSVESNFIQTDSGIIIESSGIKILLGTK